VLRPQAASPSAEIDRAIDKTRTPACKDFKTSEGVVSPTPENGSLCSTQATADERTNTTFVRNMMVSTAFGRGTTNQLDPRASLVRRLDDHLEAVYITDKLFNVLVMNL
jgi:hypothetical protein